MPPVKEKTENAFVIIHFGSNPKYFELELYFCIMLAKHTNQNIIYMYAQDTPMEFAVAIEPYVYMTIGFNDELVTYNKKYESAYTSFNTLRTCDFIFAYNLVQYKKICIIESDLVIMSNIDSIFELHTPSILYYDSNITDFNKNKKYRSFKDKVLANCKSTSRMNGGVILITPDKDMFETYRLEIDTIVNKECKYPNEILFEYVNRNFYNLPIKYNLSHYLTLQLPKYNMNSTGEDVIAFHFNEAEYKHLDIVKEKWFEKNSKNVKLMEKYRVRKIPILFFEKTVYNFNSQAVDNIMNNLDVYKKDARKKFYNDLNRDKNMEYKNVWIEQRSEQMGCPYWYNPFTGETTWTKPRKHSKKQQSKAKNISKGGNNSTQRNRNIIGNNKSQRKTQRIHRKYNFWNL